MIKKIIGASLIIMSLVVALPVLAENNENSGGATVTSVPAVTMTAEVSAKIACVATAVATRESALAIGVTAHNQAVQTAYSTRATALADAYKQTTVAGVKGAVKTAWSSFNSSVKSANKTWKKVQSDTWSTFKTAAKACKAPNGVSDLEKHNSETSD